MGEWESKRLHCKISESPSFYGTPQTMWCVQRLQKKVMCYAVTCPTS
jgi:hypothetical protein